MISGFNSLDIYVVVFLGLGPSFVVWQRFSEVVRFRSCWEKRTLRVENIVFRLETVNKFIEV